MPVSRCEYDHASVHTLTSLYLILFYAVHAVTNLDELDLSLWIVAAHQFFPILAF